MRARSAFCLALSITCCFTIGAPLADAQAINLDAAPRLRLIEERRFGSSTDPNSGFTRIIDVTLDRDGNVYVFDMPPFSIKVFAPDGRFLRAIGRQGQGPGEFEGRGHIIGAKGDTLWARTQGGAGCESRVVLFKRDGTYLSSHDLAVVRVDVRNDQLGVAYPIEMLPNGRVITGEITCFVSRNSRAAGGSGGGGRGGTTAPPVPAPAAAAVTPVDARIPRLAYDLTTGRADTLGWFVRPGDTLVAGLEYMTIEGRNQLVPRAPRDVPVTLAYRDGRAVVFRPAPRDANASTIRVVRTNIRGDTTWNLALRYSPVRYTGAVLDSIAEQSVRVAPGSARNPFSNPTAARAAVRAEMRFPIFQMPVSRAVTGVDGTVWLRREDSGAATVLWHIIEANGQLRGTVSLPRSAQPEWMQGQTVWVVQLDDDDVPWLVRYRVERAG